MRVLVISTDRKLLEKESTVFKRHQKYAQQFTAMDVLVLGGKGELQGEKLHLYGIDSGLSFLRGLAAFVRAIKLERSEVITAQDPFENGLLALAIARWHGARLHVQVHTDFLRKDFVRHSFLNRIRRAIARFVLPRASGIRVVSENIKDSLQAALRTLPAISVLPIYVDIEKYANIVRTKHPRFKIAILWIGRLEKEKCPLYAIQLLEIVRRNGNDAGLMIVGMGSEDGTLKKYARTRELERFIEFAGYQNNLAPYFASADLMVVTSVYEGYGMAIVEALAAGVPVISTDVGIANEAGAIVVERKKMGRALLDWIAHGPRKGELQSYPYQSEEEYVNAWCNDVRASGNC